MLYLKCIFVSSLLKAGYAVFAGLERIEIFGKLEFSERYCYLESLGYHGAFLEYLRDRGTSCTLGSRSDLVLPVSRSKVLWLSVSGGNGLLKYSQLSSSSSHKGCTHSVIEDEYDGI